STADQRLIIGGGDDAIDLPLKRDASVSRKAEKLRRKFAARFPDIPVEIAFAWAGTFAETSDGLPFFGPHSRLGPRVHFAMAYGGNGITYSAIGADIIRDRLTGRKHPCADLFSFDRLQRR
ncbi:MAG TPA: FAD-dependent oxidoreductase, partial [Dokdonella sp.]|nr:FAD-dependent oxidoreductase [Dokdonella sp.]